MERKDIAIIGLVAILVAIAVSAGVAYGAVGPNQNSTRGGMMGGGLYGGSMMGGAAYHGGMMGTAGMMGSEYPACYQYMQNWNYTAAP